jgi:hypothetical protein
MYARTAIATVLGAFLAAAPAGAVENLTGTYEGKIKCQSLVNGVFDTFKQDLTVEILDDGAEGVAVELVTFDPRAFIGFVVPFPKPQSGVLSAGACAFASPGNLNGGTLQGEVKTKPGSDKASVRFNVTLMDDATLTAETCLVTAKRVSSTAPTLPVCAPDTLVAE